MASAGRISVAAVMGIAFSIAGASGAHAQGSVPQADASRVARGMADICEDCVASKFTACGKFLEGPAFDRDGNMWMVSIQSGEIHKVTPDGVCTTAANTGGEPQGMKALPDGTMIGSDRKIGLFRLDPATAKVERITNNYFVQNFAGLNDLVVDSLGGVYVTDPYGSSILHPSGRVYYLPAGEKKVLKVMDDLAFPNGIGLSPDGKVLYVTEFSAKRVIAASVVQPGVVSPELIHVVANLSGGAGPDGMTVDRKGTMYVAQYNARAIFVINAENTVLGTITLPPEAGPGTTNVALHEGSLYITEARRNEVWRVKLKPGAR